MAPGEQLVARVPVLDRVGGFVEVTKGAQRSTFVAFPGHLKATRHANDSLDLAPGAELATLHVSDKALRDALESPGLAHGEAAVHAALAQRVRGKSPLREVLVR
jgi:hypothetical protein